MCNNHKGCGYTNFVLRYLKEYNTYMSKSIHIAHLARACYPFHPPGGLEQHVYHLTLELARLGQRVTLFTPPPIVDQTVSDPAWSASVRHVYVPYSTVNFFRRNSIPDRLLNYPLFARRLAQKVGDKSAIYDVVHAHGLVGWGYAVKPLPGVPLFLNPHGMEEFKVGSRAKRTAYYPFRALVRQAAARAAKVIATDAALVPEIEQYLHILPQKIALVPNAVALDEIDNYRTQADEVDISRRYALGNNFVFLSIGRLETNKGFHIMLEALAQIRQELDERVPGWRWLVAGTGSQAATLENQAQRLNLQERGTWLGAVDDKTLHALYARANLFVHPTLYEGSSLVTLEAMAHAKPVLASRTGGLPDKVFSDGENANGRLCPPGEASALSRALLDMVNLPQAELVRLGNNSRKLVEERFSWSAAARKTLELYQGDGG
jgi:glycogen synthase